MAKKKPGGGSLLFTCVCIVAVSIMSMAMMPGCSGAHADTPEPPQRCVILSFTAKWCTPCQENKLALKKLRELGVRVIEVDIDKNPVVAYVWHIVRVPTYVVFDKRGDMTRTHSVKEAAKRCGVGI